MKKIVLLSVLGMFFLCGCARKVVVSEVLQQGTDDRLYTKYNIFYTDPQNISCLNFINGSIIPYGTEVEIVECDEENLSFKAVGSEQLYKVKFSKGERMTSMHNYLRMLLGFETRETISKKIRPEFLAKVRAGEIAVGMKKEEIAVSWGRVPPVHTPDEKNMTWIYMNSHYDLVRLIFKGDTLRTVMPKLQEEK